MLQRPGLGRLRVGLSVAYQARLIVVPQPHTAQCLPSTPALTGTSHTGLSSSCLRPRQCIPPLLAAHGHSSHSTDTLLNWYSGLQYWYSGLEYWYSLQSTVLILWCLVYSTILWSTVLIIWSRTLMLWSTVLTLWSTVLILLSIALILWSTVLILWSRILILWFTVLILWSIVLILLSIILILWSIVLILWSTVLILQSNLQYWYCSL